MVTRYRCTNDGCKAEDRDRTTNPPVVLICWNCSAGKDAQTFSQMMELREGMFQIDENGNFPWERAA